MGCAGLGRAVCEQDAREVVFAALDHGVNVFDTADVYAGGTSEEILGRALAGARSTIQIATKFGG